MARVVARVGQEDLIIKDLARFSSEEVVRKVTRTVTHLHNGTPRDTGFAASNWLVSIGSPTSEIAGSKAAVNGLGWRSSLGALKGWRLGQGDIFINNNVPYIGRLNDGWSAQAPAGFVEAAIEAGAADVGGGDE